jgi:hypothetical protein
MKTWLNIFLGVCLLLNSGCSASFRPRRATTTTAAYLLTICRDETTDHLAYMGSDAQFDYVFHSQLFGGGTYRVPVSAWHLKRTFPLGTGKPYVLVSSMFPAVTKPSARARGE